MRPARADVPWSRGRVRRRRQYGSYITSPAWYRRREEWVAEWHATNKARPAGERQSGPACLVCDRPWTERTGDLHHVTYDRLGAELFADLVPLCREHHTALHDLYDRSPAWRRLGRRAATHGIIAALRRRHMREPEPNDGPEARGAGRDSEADQRRAGGPA